MKWVSAGADYKIWWVLSTYGNYLARIAALLVMKVEPVSDVWTKVSKRLI